jgi:Metallo-beta-lactamase superfamily
LAPTDRPPSPTEVEVSIFGPGHGEAVAAHLGAGQWMLVDSCLDAEGEPAALSYLDSIGVAPEQVVLIVCTHWHDDHIGGLARTAEACTEADFAYSGALRGGEFFALVKAYAERSQMKGRGVAEFAQIARLWTDRGDRVPRVAVESRRLWHRADDGMPGVSVEALSPCDAQIQRSQEALASLFPHPNTDKRAVIASDPNHASVVLSVTVGEVGILLGADLEETGNPATGWSALLDHAALDVPASIFKVPHHGSPDADQPRVWEELLVERPWAVVTPFVWGSTRRPTGDDQARISARTDRVYLTSPPERRRKTRSLPVERALKEMDARPEYVDPPMGQVRLRRELAQSGVWRVDLFGPAFQLKAPIDS